MLIIILFLTILMTELPKTYGVLYRNRIGIEVVCWTYLKWHLCFGLRYSNQSMSLFIKIFRCLAYTIYYSKAQLILASLYIEHNSNLFTSSTTIWHREVISIHFGPVYLRHLDVRKVTLPFFNTTEHVNPWLVRQVWFGSFAPHTIQTVLPIWLGGLLNFNNF